MTHPVTGFQVTSLAVVIRDLNETGRVRRTPSGSLSSAKTSRAQPTVRRGEDHPPRRFREIALTRSIFPPKSNRWRAKARIERVGRRPRQLLLEALASR